MGDTAKIYNSYNSLEKEALKAIRNYMQERLQQSVPLSDVIAAVEPEMETPDYLKNV